MAYKIRVASRKQQLKKPDEFIGTVDWLGEQIRKHAGLVWAIFVVAVVIAAGIGVFWYYQHQQEMHALALEFQGSEYYRQQPPAGEKTTTASKEENYKKAIEQYQKTIQDYPGTPSAFIAQLYIGNTYMELNDFDSAVSAYRSFLEKEPKNDIWAGLAYQRLGYAFLAKNDFEEAQKAFESVGHLTGALNKDQADYELGRINETLGKKEEAIKRYQEITRQFSDSLFLAEAQRRLTALGVTEVKPEPTKNPVIMSPSNKPITVVPTPQQKPAQKGPSTPTEKK
ncbi:MAG TPA: tetratricopeptide repeat protein [Nitrospiria bacterium]|nr:tetratricopeptide repeat protein [Nitrospiria bacterium]